MSLNGGETLDDLMVEAQDAEAALSIEVLEPEDETPKEPNLLTKMAAGAPLIATNTFWKKAGLPKATKEESAAIYKASMEAISSYGEIPLPPWVEAVFGPIEQLVKPWVGLGVVIYGLTEQRIEEAEKSAPKPSKTEPENEDDLDGYEVGEDD